MEPKQNRNKKKLRRITDCSEKTHHIRYLSISLRAPSSVLFNSYELCVLYDELECLRRLERVLMNEPVFSTSEILEELERNLHQSKELSQNCSAYTFI